MPSVWSLRLDGPVGAAIPVEAPHAVVSRWLDDDHQAQAKPYAIAPPSSAGHRTVLTVRLLNDSLAGRLAARAGPGEPVRLGSHWFTVVDAPTLEAGGSWSSLTERRGRSWEIRYLSPTTFRRGARTSPWPAPQSVLTSLAARWNAVDRASAPTLTSETLRSVWVSDIEGRSELLRLQNTVVSGFVGRVRYVSDGSDTQAAAVAALVAFAQYAGIGSHTAFGLGTVQVKASWPSHS